MSLSHPPDRQLQPDVPVRDLLQLFAGVPPDWRVMVDSMRAMVLVDESLRPRGIIRLDTLELIEVAPGDDDLADELDD